MMTTFLEMVLLISLFRSLADSHGATHLEPFFALGVRDYSKMDSNISRNVVAIPEGSILNRLGMVSQSICCKACQKSILSYFFNSWVSKCFSSVYSVTKHLFSEFRTPVIKIAVSVTNQNGFVFNLNWVL